MSNPFEDGQTGYDEVQVTSQAKPAAVSTGNEPKPEVIANAYEATDDTKSINAGTSTYYPPPENPNWFEKCFNWLPLRWFLFFAGFIMTGFAVLDIFLNAAKVKGIGILIFIYLFFFYRNCNNDSGRTSMAT